MRSRLLMSLALWQRQQMSLADRRALVDEAMQIAESLDERRTLADVLSQHHRALHGPEIAAEALADADRIDEMAHEFDDELLAFQAMNVRVMTTFQLGEWDTARAHAVERAEIGERLRSFEGRRLALMWDLLEAQVRGEFDQATETLRQLEALIGRYPSDVRGRFLAAALASKLWVLGRADVMYEMMPPTVNRDLSLAWFAADSGQLPAARHHLDESGGVERMMNQSDYMWSHDVVSLTRASRGLVDTRCAAELYEAVIPFRRNHATMGALAFLGTMEHHLGTIAATLRDFDAAVEHYERAIERHAAMSSRPFLALSRAELASTLRRRDQAGDPERSAELSEQALFVADELGLGLVHAELKR